MKRKEFFRKAAIGTAATLVGYPLFGMQLGSNPNRGKYSSYNVLSWENTEHVSPYADSNLWIRQGGSDILNATQSSSGTIDPINGSQNIDVIQMGIGNNSWPAGYSGYLYITWTQYGQYSNGQGYEPYASGTLYDNEVTSWKQGIIDSYIINLGSFLQADGVAKFEIYCYTGPSGM